jgi:hypothetical protein
LEQSQKDRVAIGHFNVGGWVLLNAVLASGQELKVPVVVGASEGEREFIGVRQFAALVRSFREECDCPVYLNADHTHSLAKAVEAARAGFDAVVFDLSALQFEQNVRQTKEAVETLKTIKSVLVLSTPFSHHHYSFCNIFSHFIRVRQVAASIPPSLSRERSATSELVLKYIKRLPTCRGA